jgi:hypothetical protein
MDTEAIASRVFRDFGGGVRAAGFVAIPGHGEARWLLPKARCEIADVLASWMPYRLKSRFGWAAVRAASKVGRLAELPGTAQVQVECPRAEDWAEFGWRSREAPIPVIYVGTPGPRRKAVVHLVGAETGECKAVVKIPLTDEARFAVLQEALVLEVLAADGFAWAPRLLYVDRDKGIATQTFVEGRSGTRKLGPELWRLLSALMLPGETTTLSSQAQQWLEQFGDVSDGSCVAQVVAQLRDDSPLQACWEHGDFAPWNIKRLGDGRCALIDWEDAQRCGLPLLDAFRFLHMQDLLFNGKPRLHARDLYEPAKELRVTPAQCNDLEAAYLVRAYMASQRDGNLRRATFVGETLTLWERQES